MKVGTRSLLFGVHQFAYHPVAVWLAWRWLYGTAPTWREVLCILVHDWGYWNCAEMDGPEGTLHPCRGASLMYRLLGADYGRLVALHSRTYAKSIGLPPSALAWPDKLSLCFYPRRLYLFLARLSGELAEYRQNAARYTSSQGIPPHTSDEEWFDWVKEHLTQVALRGVSEVQP